MLAFTLQNKPHFWITLNNFIKIANYFSNIVREKCLQNYSYFVAWYLYYIMLERIRAEYNFIKQFPQREIEVSLVGNNWQTWRALIRGPKDTPYEDGEFILSINFPPTYPTTLPDIKFVTPVYHPNIHVNGTISVTVFYNWNPNMSISTALHYVIGLLANPEGGGGHRMDLRAECNNNRAEFNRKARAFTLQHASKKSCGVQ